MMLRSPIKPVGPPAPTLIEVAEIVDIAFAGSGGHIDLSIREVDGNTIMLRIAGTTMAEALARWSDKAVLILETSTAEPAAKLNAPVGEWEIVQDLCATTPTLECRTTDGCGVAVAFTYDPITAIPQLRVAVDL